jgi:hypothetical protein
LSCTAKWQSDITLGGGDGGCARYMPGLMMGAPGKMANLTGAELLQKMDWLLGLGVRLLVAIGGAVIPCVPDSLHI